MKTIFSVRLIISTLHRSQTINAILLTIENLLGETVPLLARLTMFFRVANGDLLPPEFSIFTDILTPFLKQSGLILLTSPAVRVVVQNSNPGSVLPLCVELQRRRLWEEQASGMILYRWLAASNKNDLSFEISVELISDCIYTLFKLREGEENSVLL